MSAASSTPEALRGSGVPGFRRNPYPPSLARPAISNREEKYLVRAFLSWRAGTGISEKHHPRGSARNPGTPETGGVR